MSVISNSCTDMTLSGGHKCLIIHACWILFIPLHEKIEYLLYKPWFFFSKGITIYDDRWSDLYVSLYTLESKFKKIKETFCN